MDRIATKVASGFFLIMIQVQVDTRLFGCRCITRI